MADMSYQDELSNIGNLSDQDLASLKATVLSAFEAADANDDLVAMSAAAEALDQVNEVSKSRQGEVTNDTESLGGDPSGSDIAGQNSVAPMAASAAEDEDDDDDDSDEGDDAGDGDGDAVTADASEGADVPPDVVADAVADEPVLDTDGEPIEGVTAGSMPPGLAKYEFKKKGAKAPKADDAEDEDEEDDESVTASSSEGQQNLEETNVPVEQIDIATPEERRPLVASATSVIYAGTDIPQVAAGSEFTEYKQVSEAFTKRLESTRNARGMDGDKVIVASVRATVTDDSRHLSGEDSNQLNAEKINTVINEMRTLPRGALVASGGYCAPLETRYDIFGVGITDRPIRDSLAGFQATRGGIRYVSPPILSSFSGAVGLWTAANDANPSSPATKPFLTAACQSEITVTADAITLEIQFGNLMTRAYPELVARNNELGLIYQARFAEQTLLNKISALSTPVSSSWVLGTSRDFLNSIGRLASAYRTRHRLNHNDALRVIAPAWLLDAMREDMTRGSVSGGEPGMGIEWADSLINAALAARNVNITWHLDDPTYTGVQNLGPINEFPAAIKYWLFAEGTFLFLDGGTLDLGIVRDSTLVGTNDYRMFVETFEGLAKVGIESIQATVTTHITGANYGTIAPSSTPT